MDRAEAKKITLGKRELKSAKKRYLEAMKLLCALPGAPTVYYGDEIGMTGMADPWNRAPMNWDDPDEKLLEGVRELLHKRRDNPSCRPATWRWRPWTPIRCASRAAPERERMCSASLSPARPSW